MAKEVKCACGAIMIRKKVVSERSSYEYGDGEWKEIQKTLVYYKHTFTSDR